MDHKFPYKWFLKDGYPAKGISPNGLNVFGTFVCGGGSTMGYKLAGFNHLGGVEIDKEVANVYRQNHNPKHFYNMDIRDFSQLNDLPEELFNLDLLDGSPPCSTFSMAGSREKAWNKKKKFREGQAKQTLDDLVFVYLETIEKLKPKVALLENVKGLMQGNAKGYLKEIYKRFTNIGYSVQVFLLNAAKMGVPQRRERVFVIGLRNDFDLPKLKLKFNEEKILYGDFKSKKVGKALTKISTETWSKRKPTDESFAAIHKRTIGVEKRFSAKFIDDDNVPKTLCAGSDSLPIRRDSPHRIHIDDAIRIGAYPKDYNFNGIFPLYLIGMSVPPVMTAQIANQINLQWLSKIQKAKPIDGNH